MTELRQFSFIKLVLSGLFLTILSACGGGGGSGDPGFIGGGIQDPETGNGTLTLTLTDSNGNPTDTITTDSPGTLTATYREGANSSGQLADVSTTIGSINPSSALTDENGVATFLVTAGETTGAGTATVTVLNVTAEINFQVVSTGSGGPSNLSITLADTDGNAIDTINASNPGVVTVTYDGGAAGSDGEIVDVSTSLGSIDPSSDLTDANGVATFALTAGSDVGAGTVTATVQGVTATLNFRITSEDAGGPANLSIELTDSAGNPTDTISSTSPGVITVNYDGGGSDSEGEIVNVTTTLGSIAPTTGLTDSTGTAVFSLQAGNDIGAGTVTATVQGISASVNFQIIQGGAEEPATLTLVLTDVAGNPTDTISTANPGVVTAIYNAGANSGGQIINLSSSLGNVTPATGLTNINGVAVFSLEAGSDFGAGTLTASAPDTSAELNFQIIQSNEALSLVLTDSSGNPTDTISSAAPGIVTVTYDDDTAEVAGQLVSVQTSVGSISPQTALTNEDGVAAFILEAADDAGAGTVTATVLDITSSLNFEIQSISQGSNVLVLTLTDNEGNETTNITDIAPATLTVSATDSFGQPVANVIISAEVTVGVLAPESGTALTDLNGIATFTIASDGVTGAGTVTATLSGVSSSLNYQIGEANLRIGRIEGGNFVEGEIAAGALTLPAAGSTPLSVAVVDDEGDLVSNVVPVSFTSGCASLSPPLAQLAAEVNTINGIATATYLADGCTGTDTVTAAIVQGNTQTATVELEIDTSPVNSIAFESAEPPSIALRGTGGAGRSETSRVTFQVLDATDSPAAGVTVTFGLSTTAGGIQLTNDTATSNEEGFATAIVQSGDVATSVRVTATIDVDGELLSTVSDILVVSTGLPDQNSVSLAVVRNNPGGLDEDKLLENWVTMRMADKFNNPVPDGTTISFTTEYGAIGDSCVTGAQFEGFTGGCVVDWTSQAPRLPLLANDTGPDGEVSTINNRECPDYIVDDTDPTILSLGRPCPSDLGGIIAGQSTILAIAVGEETFIDVNGNGLYDEGEPFEDLPEAFLDKNLNGVFDNRAPFCTPDAASLDGRECAEGLEEIFFDFNENGVYDEGNGIYNGVLCPQALANAGICTRELVHVRGQNVITMSATGSLLAEFYQFVSVPEGEPPLRILDFVRLAPGGASVSGLVAISDVFNNPPAAASTVSIVAEECEIIADESTIPSIGANGAFLVGFTVVNQSDNTANLVGSITVTLTPEDGDPVSASIECIDEAG